MLLLFWVTGMSLAQEDTGAPPKCYFSGAAIGPSCGSGYRQSRSCIRCLMLVIGCLFFASGKHFFLFFFFIQRVRSREPSRSGVEVHRCEVPNKVRFFLNAVRARYHRAQHFVATDLMDCDALNGG
uniref:Uncharacterized protein n=1 Tax=Rhipicephalus appendiculatus TaxID=34631 RepID=A0A131YD37_RHIAP